MIHLYDTSAMLYIGDSVTRPADDYISEKLKGLPVRGLRYTIEKLITANADNLNTVIAVMDSRTNKNELYPDYKSQRKLNREVFVQRELLKYLLPKLGITMLIQDNFEADDLFYCYIISRYIEHIKKPYSNILPSDGVEIHCDDRDLLGCVMHSRIFRVGLTSKTPTVFVGNYESILQKSGYLIQYNSVLPHEMFYGKQSNNLHKMKTIDANKGYLSFIKFCTENKINNELWSTELIFNKFLVYAKSNNIFEESTFKELEERKPVVFPRLSWDKNKAIVQGKLDKSIATDFLSILQERNLLSMLGLNYKSEEQVNPYLLDKWISLYRSGVIDADSYMTSDSTFYFTDTSLGSNIGGF